MKPKKAAPKARKTYVVTYFDSNGHYRQEYFQNKRKAESRSRKLGVAKGKAHLSFWIDGAEMIRLARRGYVYDSRTDSVVRSRNVKGFVKEVDAMPRSKRESMFLDYRKFRNTDDVIAFHEKKRRGKLLAKGHKKTVR